MTQGVSIAGGKWNIPDEWAKKWAGLVNRARTWSERYDRVCDVIREIGFAAGDVMKNEPPERDVPMYAFQLGIMGINEGDEGDVTKVFNDAGHMIASLLVASLDPFNLPEDNTAFMNAFYEGVRDRVDSG